MTILTVTYFLKNGNTYKVSSKEALDLHDHLPAGNYTYDLNLTAPDTTVYKILQGVFVVNASVVQ